ncbi:Predicted ATPase [Hymenobacter daecheongensis DSM 21074]|uniref:Predicted ATPase n=1 Tax=Hymenobacter daecheongensis DSM 21074 TaxID=1121955 RepID=A0A1M6LHW1_9BACT|nr:AAA family ATPase [Hymenobacter daecheongensis]SHJ70796.1 Predicted ATPase [Hymenobacter daecheongensis DSM 21074]
MNEQLVVKNFGPIKDATVDFKKVTVFIGPTGGGKSTLAKLAAIFRSHSFLGEYAPARKNHFRQYSIDTFLTNKTQFQINSGSDTIDINESMNFATPTIVHKNANEISDKVIASNEFTDEQVKILSELILFSLAKKRGADKNNKLESTIDKHLKNKDKDFYYAMHVIDTLIEETKTYEPSYIPSERIFIPAIEYSWAGLMRDDISLPKNILNFANFFNANKSKINRLNIPFLNVEYIHENGNDFIKNHQSETLVRLYEAASGIQSVTPLLVVLEYLQQRTKSNQSFIIEELELNLFPIAQFELAKILISKCAQLNTANDLILTTHSPYVLTALNLMCYAYRIAQQDEATAKKVAKLIPRDCWIDPAQFAAYYVDLPGTKKKQQVRSIINKKTGLIEENELDTASLELGDIFNKLVRLRQPAKAPASAK